MKFINFFIYFIIIFITSGEVFAKDRILVLTDTGGGAHISTAAAIQSALENEYEIEQYKPFEELFGRQLYNSSLQRGSFSSLWWIVRGQRLVERLLPKSSLMNALEEKIDIFKPKLIISVIPIANAQIYEMAKIRNIPYLVQSTDIYSKHFFRDLKNPGTNFWVGVHFQDVLPKYSSKNIPLDHFVLTGYALRPEFQKTNEELQEEIKKLKSELNIQEDEQIVSIAMGAQGSGVLLQKYVDAIGNSSIMSDQKRNLHVVALCGKNQIVQQAIEQKKFQNTYIKIHALGQQDSASMAALMRLSHVLISKPGGATVNEGLASNVFTLFDTASTDALYWEKRNMKFSILKGAGQAILPHQFIPQLTAALNSPRPNIQDCPGRNFSQNIQNFVRKVISPMLEDSET